MLQAYWVWKGTILIYEKLSLYRVLSKIVQGLNYLSCAISSFYSTIASTEASVAGIEDFHLILPETYASDMGWEFTKNWSISNDK